MCVAFLFSISNNISIIDLYNTYPARYRLLLGSYFVLIQIQMICSQVSLYCFPHVIWRAADIISVQAFLPPFVFVPADNDPHEPLTVQFLFISLLNTDIRFYHHRKDVFHALGKGVNNFLEYKHRENREEGKRGNICLLALSGKSKMRKENKDN